MGRHDWQEIDHAEYRCLFCKEERSEWNGEQYEECPMNPEPSTPQSPKEAVPGRYWIRPNPPYKAGVLFCGTDAEYEKVMPSCRDGLFPYVPESALAEAVRKARAAAFEEAAKEVDSWLDLLEIDHRDILAKQQYKDPQEAGREYRNKCNLLSTVRACILKKAAALSAPGEEGERNGKE